MHYILAGSFAALVWLVIVVMNERFNLLSCDRFPKASAEKRSKGRVPRFAP